ncbi:ABC transporter ATP-binding protein [Marivivens aquimaris]|uniref:ABC transporter ATP-binding protein n=1 Tax=Marivivens aquimaris TaxID=2774876 RepID=UPI0018808C62|nr:ATP-binding cassette domain-containing protein [Marivivens aquimaris]
MAASLEVKGLTLRFGGVTALDGVDLSVGAGEVVGLIGPNGSGKTSLFNVLTGNFKAEGSVLLDGRDLPGRPEQIAKSGVSRTFQNLQFASRLSVFENIRAARHARAHWRETVWQTRTSQRAEREDLLGILGLLGLAEKAWDMPESLTLVEFRHLEIARVIAADASLVLLDEPAAGMTPAETDRITATIAAHLLPNRSAIVIEHKMGLIGALCSRVAVLDAGRKIADGPLADVLNTREVRRSYFGEVA